MAGKLGEYTWSVLGMSAGFFFLFMAFNTTQALETTVLSDKTLAYASLGVLYGVFTMAAIVAPRVVDQIGPRLAMIVGAIPYVLLVFTNMAPSRGLLIPASAGVGAGAAILWTGQGIYMSRCSIREAAVTGEPVDVVTSRMNGMFWTAFQFNGAVGLLASSALLESVPTDQFHSTVKWMFAGFGALGCVGIFILSFVKPAAPLGEAPGEGGANTLSEDTEGGQARVAEKKEPVSFIATLRLLASSRPMQLLVPIILYNGTSLGLMGGTYPLMYQDGDDGTQRLLPKSAVGYIAATFYLCNSAASYCWGKFVIPRVGRKPLFVLTLVTHALFYTYLFCLATGMLTGTGTSSISIPHGSGAAYTTALAGAIVFALGDSVLESQIPAIVQSPSFFPVERDRDAANSNVRMWQSLGYAAQFGIGIAATPLIQAGINAGLMVAALACLALCDSSVRPIEAPAGGKEEGGYSQVEGAEDE